VVCHILKLTDDAAAKSLGITESAYKVRLSRARKKIGDYLAPRCEHVNPMNPCRCPARVGTALHKGFIRSVGPVGGEVSLRKPEPYGRYGTGLGNDDVPMRDIAARAGVGVGTIYRNYPLRSDLIIAVFRRELDATAAEAEQLIMYFTSLDNVKFRRPVKPGDQLRIEVDMVQRRGRMCKIHGVARVDGEIVCEADMGAMVRDR